MYTTVIINALLWLAALAAVFGVFGLAMRGLEGADWVQRGTRYDPAYQDEDLAAAA